MSCKNSIFFGSQLPIDINISGSFAALAISANTGVTGANFAIKDFSGNTIVTKSLGSGIANHPTDTKKLRVTLENSDYGTTTSELQADNTYDMFLELTTAALSDLEEVNLSGGDKQLFIKPRNISVT